MMSRQKLFEAAFPYGEDILALPVANLDQASAWYSKYFGLQEIDRRDSPHPTVMLERDGVQIGFAINGLDPANEGAAIRVNDIHRAKDELESRGVRSATGGSTNGTARDCRCFSSLHPTDCATTSISRSTTEAIGARQYRRWDSNPHSLAATGF